MDDKLNRMQLQLDKHASQIAKLFSTDDSSMFVNGILDSVYNDSLKGLI